MDVFGGGKIEFKVFEVFPRTLRNQEYLRQKEEAERAAREEQELAERQRRERDQKLKDERLEAERQRKAEEKKRKEEEQRRQEEEEQRSRLEGAMEKFIKELSDNKTLSEFSLSGLDLGPVRCRLIAQALEGNKTLKGLHMARKQVQDDEGEELIRRVALNKCLTKLEIEGNNLTSNSCRRIGELIAQNKTLRVIDLEGNSLVSASDYTGINSIARALRTNKSLLSLNLSNCGLDKTCGIALADAMKVNFTLISMDLVGNYRIDIQQVQEIQDCLIRNKRLYDEERFREWEERKRMRKEEERTEMIDTTIEREHIKTINMKSREIAALKQKRDRWEEEKANKELAMKKDMEKLMNLAKKRAEKKRPRRKRSPKKS
mmetsp:Transcript_15998/g.29298  ORF Transcript_15998/g.29298 Transcript_15998/m.29298 type:complete len:375 (+) Transcript_15998:125-1249(+)|eukprot:CAMPEP_0204913116 /NCGR_PEP_ID=MMETSP1397-20131031/11122_1 /ASSEMBLY_ACC=CAM_ASM_000891 /TAXON_ID=49980 /ORGANISM="Climacostomum Climacostomum virens, Strain Stock W-24" /LENGTH=374 /DNA_ID=CAMNT_0052084305 /DNA_START=106 /DNA_END=1230 /DNA_ORIENTATION=+